MLRAPRYCNTQDVLDRGVNHNNRHALFWRLDPVGGPAVVSVNYIVITRDNDWYIDLIQDSILDKTGNALAVNLLLRWPKIPRLLRCSVALDMVGLADKLREAAYLSRVVKLGHVFTRDAEVAGAYVALADTEILGLCASGGLPR